MRLFFSWKDWNLLQLIHTMNNECKTFSYLQSFLSNACQLGAKIQSSDVWSSDQSFSSLTFKANFSFWSKHLPILQSFLETFVWFNYLLKKKSNIGFLYWLLIKACCDRLNTKSPKLDYQTQNKIFDEIA